MFFFSLPLSSFAAITVFFLFLFFLLPCLFLSMFHYVSFSISFIFSFSFFSFFLVRSSFFHLFLHLRFITYFYYFFLLCFSFFCSSLLSFSPGCAITTLCTFLITFSLQCSTSVRLRLQFSFFFLFYYFFNYVPFTIYLSICYLPVMHLSNLLSLFLQLSLCMPLACHFFANFPALVLHL